MTLAFALGEEPEPGSNLPGGQADTSWLFVLPRLDLRSVAFVGDPHAGTTTALAALGVETISVTPGRGMGDRGRFVGGPDASVEPDLVYVTAPEVRRVMRDPAVVRLLDRTLRRGGFVYVERRDAPGADPLVRALAVERGVLLSADPAGPSADPAGPSRESGGPRALGSSGTVSAWLVPRTPPPVSGLARWLVRIRRVLTRTVGRRFARTRSTLEGRAPGLIRVAGHISAVKPPPNAAGHGMLVRPDDPAGGLPAYVADAARAAGCELDPWAWELQPARGYRSQKVVFFVTRTDSDGRAVVKVTQDPRFNRLLDNEHTSLGEFDRAGLASAILAPRPLFRAEHAGLTIVGQTALEGQGFRACSDGSSSCPVALATLAALTALGAKSAVSVDGAALGTPLRVLLDRYRRLYRPRDDEARFLEQEIDVLAASKGVPTVFLHGDPTTFNLIIGPEGHVSLVDWENAESEGVPLWDLFHFLHVYGDFAAERAGRRYTPSVFRSRLLDPTSPLAGVTRQAVRGYCSSVELAAELVEPLFHTCWMQLAVRQARRLRPSELQRGNYVGILRAAIAERRRRPHHFAPW